MRRSRDGSCDRPQRSGRAARFGAVMRYLLVHVDPRLPCPDAASPLADKEGGTLRTVADAANYIVALPEDRRRAHWDRAAQLLLDLADPLAQLALFYDRQLNLKMPPRRDLNIRARVITRRLPIINSSDTSQ